MINDVTNTFTISIWAQAAAGKNHYLLFPSQGSSAWGDDSVGVGLWLNGNIISVQEHTSGYMPNVVGSLGDFSRWTQVCVVYSNQVPRLYLDGQLVATGPKSPRVVRPSSGLHNPHSQAAVGGFGGFGNTDNPDSNWFQGSLDEIRIYNRALSEAEVQQLYTYEAAPAQAFQTNGLVAYYPFNGNANDESGNGNNGTVVGATLSADRFGNANSAYQFNRTNNYIEVRSSPSLAFGAKITASTWIRLDRLYPRQYQEGFYANAIVGKGFGVDGFGADGVPDWFFGINGDVQRVHLNSGRWMYWDSTQALKANVWQHVAFTYDGIVMKTYLDGVQSGEQPASGVLMITDTAMTIGAYAPETNGPIENWYFGGLIDDVRIYNRALSASEIQQLYLHESQPSNQPVVIVQQPINVSAVVSRDVTFQISATGTEPLAYQWKFNGTPIAGATSTSLVLKGVTSSNAGSYTVDVSNSFGAITSNPAVLTVLFPPTITLQPRSQRVLAGADASFTVTAAGSEPLSYQWSRNGIALPGVNSATCLLRAVTPLDEGTYLVTVSNPYGTVSSDPALLTVVVPNYILRDRTPGGGVVLREPNKSSFPPGSLVNLTAEPYDGWTFLDWKDDAEGTNPVAQVAMSFGKNVRARFGTPVTLLPSASGTVAVDPPSAFYPYNAPVRIIATPQMGNYFAFWFGSATGDLNPLSILVREANPTVSASFLPLPEGKVALTIVPDGYGKVTVAPRANLFSIGQTVTNTALPDPGQEFLGWSGDAQGLDNPLVVTLDRSKTITARFTRRPRLDLETSGKDAVLLTLTGEFSGTFHLLRASDLSAWSEIRSLTNAYGETQLRYTAADAAAAFKTASAAAAQRQATAIPTVVNGFVIAITVTDGGDGYATAPSVTISGGGGAGAIASATILRGKVDKVIVVNAGSGYTETPTVLIAPRQP